MMLFCTTLTIDILVATKVDKMKICNKLLNKTIIVIKYKWIMDGHTILIYVLYIVNGNVWNAFNHNNIIND